MSAAESHSKCGPAYLSNNVHEGEDTGKSAIGRMDVFRHLEKVETLRCYWELKHVQLKGLGQVGLSQHYITLQEDGVMNSLWPLFLICVPDDY